MGPGPQPVMVTVGVQTDGAALPAELVSSAGKDNLMSAARQEILRLKEINTQLLQDRRSGGSLSLHCGSCHTVAVRGCCLPHPLCGHAGMPGQNIIVA